MDVTQQPLVSNAEIQQLLNSAAHQNHAHMISNQFAASGEHPSEVIGTGMDFADRQLYTRGDDPRFIDWRASARSSHTLIRRFHTELSAPSCVVIDRRPSMLFGTKKRLKATQAVRAGIHCGAQLLKAGQQLACLVLDKKNYWQAASNSLSTFNQSAHHAARPCPPTQHIDLAHWAHISDFLNQKLTQGSRLILISDFISPPSNAKADTKALRFLSQHYNLTLLHIKDETEQHFYQSSIDLVLNKQNHTINTQSDCQNFNQKLLSHETQLESEFKKLKCAKQVIFTHDDITHLKVV